MMKKRDIEKLNRESEALWRSQFDYISAKVGTIPKNIWIRNTSRIGVGARIEFAEAENGRIITGIITQVEPIPFIEKM
jgi:hypothetical protein